MITNTLHIPQSLCIHRMLCAKLIDYACVFLGKLGIFKLNERQTFYALHLSLKLIGAFSFWKTKVYNQKLEDINNNALFMFYQPNKKI